MPAHPRRTTAADEVSAEVPEQWRYVVVNNQAHVRLSGNSWNKQVFARNQAPGCQKWEKRLISKLITTKNTGAGGNNENITDNNYMFIRFV